MICILIFTTRIRSPGFLLLDIVLESSKCTWLGITLLLYQRFIAGWKLIGSFLFLVSLFLFDDIYFWVFLKHVLDSGSSSFKCSFHVGKFTLKQHYRRFHCHPHIFCFCLFGHSIFPRAVSFDKWIYFAPPATKTYVKVEGEDEWRYWGTFKHPLDT